MLENRFAIDISDKRLIYGIDKNSQQINEKKDNLLKNGSNLE